MWSKEPEKLWAPGASGSAEQRRVSFTHRRSVLGKHCYRGRRRGSGSASSWLFLLSERRGESFAWKVEQPVRACSPHRGIWPGFRRTPGPVSTRSSPGLQHSFVLGWISEPTPLWTRSTDAQADRRTHGGVEEERDGLSEEKRALLPSPATTEPQMDGGLRFRIRHSVARGPCWGGEGVWGGGCGLLVASQTDRAAALNAAAASFVSVFSHNTPSSSPLPLPLLCSSAGLYA